jgi:tRNA dimethylallyltransferase
VVELSEAFDAAQFVRLATAAVVEIQARGRVPIFCGGTGLYFKAWLEGLGEAPPSDARVRAELEVTPLAELLAELEQRDPLTYARIDRQNPRRVIRAVEVIRLTGKPFSAQRANWNPEVRSQKSEVIFCFSREPADLRARIETRVDTMFAGGLVEETRRLLARGLAGHRHAMQALGYRQVAAHLAGERGLAETIALVKTKTWQFARRQGTWFRSQLSVERVPLAADADATSVARGLLDRHGRRSAQ